MNREQTLKQLVALVFRLSDELENIEGADANNLWPLHPDKEPKPPFTSARPYVDEIMKVVKDFNGEELSDETILDRLLYGAAAIRMQIKISDNELAELAQRHTADLIDYSALRDVSVPLISLEVGPDAFRLGPVTFHPILETDKGTNWWRWAGSTLGDSADALLLSYAKVRVPGDSHKAIRNASELVNEALLILRGIGFVITAEDRHQFGILNEYPLWRNVPYRLDKPEETTRVDGQPELVSAIGPFRSPYDLRRNVLSTTQPRRLAALLGLFEAFGFYPEEDVAARLISGFRWLGEATKPDALAARFAKMAFALEAFIGGEAKEDNLSTRGITATLAERAAFLTSTEYDARIKVDRDVRQFYAKRSDIAHGRTSIVSADDFEQFGLLVREIGWCLLEKHNLFSTIEGLQEWIITQRYSGP